MNLKILKLKVIRKLSMFERKLVFSQFDNLFYLRLFPKNSNEIIDYSGARTLEALAKFIDSNGKEGGIVSSKEVKLRKLQIMIIFSFF